MNRRPASLTPATSILMALLASLMTFFGSAPLAPPVRAQTAPIQDLSTFPRTTLEIVSGRKVHRFEVWVANTDARKTQGLMFVRDLPADEGMLFVDCCSGIWMKNTYIELDIVFVGHDGRIDKIAPRAQPFDESTIGAPGPVEAVVELKGGEAQQLGIKVGDRVKWTPTLQNRQGPG